MKNKEKKNKEKKKVLIIVLITNKYIYLVSPYIYGHPIERYICIDQNRLI